MGLGFTGRRTHQFLGGVPGPDSLEQIRHIEATNCAARAVGSSATTRPLQDRLYQQVRSRSFDAEHARAFEIQRAHLGIYDLEKTAIKACQYQALSLCLSPYGLCVLGGGGER